MARLGTALTPVQLRVDAMPGAVNLDMPGTVVCQTADFAVTDYPRTAYIDLSMTASAVSDVTFAADLVKTTDNGATWQTLTVLANRASVAANTWTSVANLANADLDVGQIVRFGVRLWRDAIPGSGHLVDSRCQLRALIHSRTGNVSPF